MTPDFLLTFSFLETGDPEDFLKVVNSISEYTRSKLGVFRKRLFLSEG